MSNDKEKDIFVDGFKMDSDKDGNNKKDFLENLNKEKDKEKIESFQEEKFVYQKTNYWKWIIQIIIIAIAAVTAFLLLNQKVEIIDFRYMSYQDAATWASDKDLIVTINADYSNEVDEEQVISQNIEPGTKVSKDTNIILVVSEGLDPYEPILLPSFDSSWNRSSITNWLEKNGIENFNIVNIENEDIPSNYMISFRLIGATEQDFNRSSEIEFLFSNVNLVETLEINNFLNGSLLQVEMWATQNSVSYTYSYDYSTIYDVDRIMYQSVTAGETFDTKETISFIISLGEETDVIYMPNLINSTLMDADIWSKNNNINYTYTYDFSSIYNKDRIMNQNITTNEEVASGQTFHIIISKGDEITIPSFENVDISDAMSFMQDEGILVEIEELYKAGTDVGDFISQSITTGTKVEEGTSITIKYSLGDTITIPNYTNQLKVDFQEWVSEMNNIGASIVLTITEENNTNADYGRIISQSFYNDITNISTNIEIVVSLGSDLIVPTFSNTRKSEANSIAQDNGITVEILERYATGINIGEFVSQSIQSGTKIEAGTSVTVTYSLGDTITIPNYSNQFNTDFESWINGVNDLGANISLTAYYNFNKGVEYGRIITQNIYNEKVALDSEIKVIVSLGESYQVINFTSLKRDDIQSYCDRQGLTVIFEEVSGSGLSSGRVVSQFPVMNEIISKKDFIIIQIAE